MQNGMVTVRPATIIGRMKSTFSATLRTARGIHDASELLLARKVIVINTVILVKFRQPISGLSYK